MVGSLNETISLQGEYLCYTHKKKKVQVLPFSQDQN